MKIRYQGPLAAPIAKGQHVADLVDHHRRHAAADRAAGRRRGCRQGRLLRPHLARPQVSCSGWRERRAGKFISLEGGEGVGKSTQVQALADALDAARDRRRRHARAGRQRRRRADPRAAAERRRGSLGSRRPRPCCSRPPAPIMSRRRSARRWRRADGCFRDRFVDSSLAYQGGAGGLGIEAVRAINAFGIGDCFPDRTLVLTLDEGARAGPGARQRRQRPHRRPRRRLSPQGRRRLPPDRRRGARAGAAGRRVGLARRGHRSACSTPSRTCCRDRRPGPRGRAVRERLGDRASCTMRGCSPGPRASARRASRDAAARRVLADAAGPPFDLPGPRHRRRSSDRQAGRGRQPSRHALARAAGEREDRQPRPQHQRRPGARARRVPRPDRRRCRRGACGHRHASTSSSHRAPTRCSRCSRSRRRTALLPRQPCAGAAAADHPLALPAARFPDARR